MKKELIENYIKAYNRYDIEGMLSDMHKDVRFENISNGEITLTTNGKLELRKQAEQSKEYFKERTQKIVQMDIGEESIEIQVDYTAILAIDFPGGPKAGDKIELKGKSIFKFQGDKIISLKDIS